MKTIKLFILLLLMLIINNISNANTITIFKIDTLIVINDQTTIDSLKTVIIKLNTKLDTLQTKYKIVNTKLFVDEYKLERISYYNKIAGKNNNIKYLRGWINRVLNGSGRIDK